MGLTHSLSLLKQAGASAADTAKFKTDLAQMWPEDQAALEKYLGTQTPAVVAEYVRSLRESSPDDRYVPGPDYFPGPEVPRGKVFSFTLDRSRIFPGTTRTIRVYVPAQYTAATSACIYVSLDDLFFLSPRALDTLIDKHEIPPLIAIGVHPGVVNPVGSSGAPRIDRSLEFDGLNDQLARFLSEEVFPEVEQHMTPAGLPIRLSRDPNDHAIGGISTGGIGAFTAAWERPDVFRRVFTGIGTFVGMRGGDSYPVLVRKTEPKPIRIFMQDGSNDELTSVFGEIGDWWMSNQTMQRALEFAGYPVQHVWGEGTHDIRHAVAVFPDAMRWLWKDWPLPVTAGKSQNTFLKDILISGEGWQAVAGQYQSATALATDNTGSLMFWDDVGQRAWSISDSGQVSESSRVHRSPTGMVFGANGQLYVAESASEEVVSYGPDGKASTLIRGIRVSDLTVTHDSKLYVTESASAQGDAGRVWLLKPDGEKTLLDSGLANPTGITLSPDGSWLAVAENKTHWGYSYRVRSDGSLDGKQRFYWFHVSDAADDSGAGPWVMDQAARLYAATRMGVQVFDRSGRVRAILPLPGGAAIGLAFGGARFNVLYVSCADHKVYRRVLNAAGFPPWAPPIKLPTPDA